ncbi:hypothetical protein FHU41_002491 [Psychromicrobium silvestre]|uniref:Xaa-Pro dipeptidyl-peptidase C-terminal domain-containing protein n=1 Tax=Psychromicrobium silvestre TaxID=1645614 RepID=A0A7Y9LVB1_9MICC|nr:CocE/NonD family hydrolase [Psychromicrobium silvestre]NYE96241.1 hypothetical protein [Psychromicrobium silvestre]
MPMLTTLLSKLLGLSERPNRALSIIKDFPIPMLDGTELLADRYLPHGDPDASGPVVLMRTPYGRGGVLGRIHANLMAGQGLQVVVQSTRGSFGSQGEFRPFQTEREDGVATAEWIRQQPWCDGRLAMAGGSYVGHTQWAVGPYLEPPLEAMCLAVTTSNFVPNFYPGGTFAADDMVSWSAIIGLQEEPFAALPKPWQLRRTQAAMRGLPLGRADQAAIGKEVKFLQDVVAHAGQDDGYWKGRADHSEALPTLTVPTTMVSGWYDPFLKAQLEDFKALGAAGHPSRITIGSWRHGEPASLKVILSDQIGFLKATFDGDPAPLQRAPVRIALQHSGQWLDFDQWPPPSNPVEFFTTGRGKLAAKAAESSAESFDYSPDDPTPNIGGPLLMGESKQRDNAARESRPDVLVYSGEPLEQHLDVIGELQATIFLRSTHPKLDVFVRLCDVDPQGVSWNVCDGVLRLTDPAEAAEVREVTVQLDPTGYRFQAGHRLRLQISAGAWPRYDRNLGTAEALATASSGIPNRIEILSGTDHPTTITLPIWKP